MISTPRVARSDEVSMFCFRSPNKRDGLHLTSDQASGYNTVEQEYRSDATSTAKLPRVYRLDWVQRDFIDGKDVIDLGAGRPEFFERYVAPRYPDVVPRDPFNYPGEANDAALSGVYDTAILSNVLNVIPDVENIYSVLELARAVADTTLVTVYNSGRAGPTGRGRYQRGEGIGRYVGYCEEVFGQGNVSVRDGVIICEA